jgi:uncharacterized membrane protein YqhA
MVLGGTLLMRSRTLLWRVAAGALIALAAYLAAFAVVRWER